MHPAGGLLGLVKRRFGLPVVPAVVGVILGPLAEPQVRWALRLSNGEVSTLAHSPLSIALYTVVGNALVAPLIARLVRSLRSSRDQFEEPAGDVSTV